MSKENQEVTELDWWTARGFMHKQLKKEQEEERKNKEHFKKWIKIKLSDELIGYSHARPVNQE